MKIAIMLPNWVGDAAMATPMLRAISQHFGDQSELIGIMRPYVAHVLEGTPWLNKQILYDPKSTDRSLNTWSLTRQLRALQLDSMVLLTNSIRTGAISWLSGASRRIGYARDGRGLLLTDKLRPVRDGKKFVPISAVDSYLKLAKHLGCESAGRQLELATTKANEEGADAVWQRLGLNTGTDTITLCPGGAFGSAKHWPTKYFAELAARIVDSQSCNVLVTCGPAERENANEVARLSGRTEVVSMADEQLSIGLAKAVLKRSRLAIATDSGPRHLAAGFGVPTVAIFGSTDPRWSLNYNPHEIRLSEDVPCGPCAKRVCPHEHHRCMNDLSVDRVLNAVKSLLQRTAGRRAA
jgi:lipopolysaccharide heptosyltransferase II